MNLREALAQAGAISQEDAIRAEKKRLDRERTSSQQVASKIVRSLAPTTQNLETIDTIDDFREAAKKILLADPGLLRNVIESARRFRDAQGGKRLVAQLYDLRAALQKQVGQPETLIKQSLRRRGNKFHKD